MLGSDPGLGRDSVGAVFSFRGWGRDAAAMSGEREREREREREERRKREGERDGERETG